jgi:hypothetical protein
MQSFSPFAGYGPVPMPADAEVAIHNPVMTTAGGQFPHILSPRNPLFWFGALAAISLGLIGAGANVRVAKAKASVDVGGA